jgi:RecA/RadA recombinase
MKRSRPREEKAAVVVAVQSVTALELLRQRHLRQSLVPPLVLLPPPPPSSLSSAPSISSPAAACWPENNNDHPPDDDYWLELGPGLHELAGEAGTGKTQIALSLCVRAAAAAAAATSSTASSNSPYPKPQHVQSSSSSSTSTTSSSPSCCAAIYLALGDGSGRQSSGRLTKILQRLSQMTRETTTAAMKITCSGRRATTGMDYQSNNYQKNLGAQQQQHEDEAAESNKVLLNSIMTRAVPNVDDLLDLLRQDGDDENSSISNDSKASSSSQSLSSLMQSSNSTVRIIVLDSIADLFRIATSSSTSLHNSTSTNPYLETGMNYAQRSALLFRLAALLKQLSHRHQVPILVINQVTGSNTPSNGSNSFARGGPRWMSSSSSWFSNNSSFTQRPALGLSWAHCVTSSYTVARRERHNTNQQKSSHQQHNKHANIPHGAETTTPSSNYYFERHVCLLKSPIAPSWLKAYFVVTRSGVEQTARID